MSVDDNDVLVFASIWIQWMWSWMFCDCNATVPTFRAANVHILCWLRWVCECDGWSAEPANLGTSPGTKDPRCWVRIPSCGSWKAVCNWALLLLDIDCTAMTFTGIGQSTFELPLYRIINAAEFDISLADWDFNHFLLPLSWGVARIMSVNFMLLNAIYFFYLRVILYCSLAVRQYALVDQCFV